MLLFLRVFFVPYNNHVSIPPVSLNLLSLWTTGFPGYIATSGPRDITWPDLLPFWIMDTSAPDVTHKLYHFLPRQFCHW
jgi:hypothetical protein